MKFEIQGGEIMKEVKKSCDTCEFLNTVCMGHGVRTDNNESTYGMPIEEAKKMFPNGCSDWGVSLEYYNGCSQ